MSAHRSINTVTVIVECERSDSASQGARRHLPSTFDRTWLRHMEDGASLTLTDVCHVMLGYWMSLHCFIVTRKASEKRIWKRVMMLGLSNLYEASTALLKKVMEVDTKP